MFDVNHYNYYNLYDYTIIILLLYQYIIIEWLFSNINLIFVTFVCILYFVEYLK